MDKHREHVIAALKEAIPFVESRGYGGVGWMIHDAVELLESQPEIVRCRECRYNAGPVRRCMCDLDDEYHPLDWFCADGEKWTPQPEPPKEENANAID